VVLVNADPSPDVDTDSSVDLQVSRVYGLLAIVVILAAVAVVLGLLLLIRLAIG